MSKIKVKFQAMTVDGKNTSFTVELECPDFTKQETNINNFLSEEVIKLNLIDTSISIKEQQDDWIKELDKSDIMDQKDLAFILDWKILDNEVKIYNKYEKYEEIVSLLLQVWPGETERIADFLVIYKEMEPEIKYMGLEKRFKITLATYTAVLKGQAAFGKKLTDIFKGENLSEEQQKIINERVPYGEHSTSIYKQNRDKEFKEHNNLKQQDSKNLNNGKSI